MTIWVEIPRIHQRQLAPEGITKSKQFWTILHKEMRAKNFHMKTAPGPGCHGCQMIGKIVLNYPPFVESAIMPLFLQNGHFCMLEWPF